MRKIIYLLLNILIVENVFSQELILSNFYDNKAIFNPAFCGYQSGYRNIVLANRSFYRPNSGPFRYTSLAADLNLCAINDKIGIGLVAKNQTEGDGYLNMTSGLLQFSYTTAFGKRRRSKIGFGLQGGFNNYTIDWERLVFSDQLDAYQGNIYTSSNANAPWQSTYIPSISAGIIFYHNFKSRQSNQLWHVGLSVQNIFQPNTSLLLGNNYSPKRFIIHSGMILDYNKKSKTINEIVPIIKLTSDIFNTNILESGMTSSNTYFEAGFITNFSTPDLFAIIINYSRRTSLSNSINALTLIPLIDFNNYRIGVGATINLGGISAGNILTYELTLSSFFVSNKCKPRSPEICKYGSKDKRRVF